MQIAKRITINTPTKVELRAELYRTYNGGWNVCPIEEDRQKAEQLKEFGISVRHRGEFTITPLYMDLLTINETVFI